MDQLTDTSINWAFLGQFIGAAVAAGSVCGLALLFWQMWQEISDDDSQG